MDRRDEDIIVEYQNGDDHAMQILYERYKNHILNFSLRILGNRADAEDVTADVFLKLFEKKYTFDPKAKFSTWLFTVARNKCIDQTRKRKKQTSMWFFSKGQGNYEQWDVEDENAQTDKNLKLNETKIEVKKAIAQLKYEQREALILREYDKMSYQEISEILNCSLEKVKVLIFRAREQLKKELASFIKEGS
jgi:RNA polymerase sigma-70 factor (ECF subfamily)